MLIVFFSHFRAVLRSTAQATAGAPPPTGWNAIQYHMLSHDDAMIEDFADDIDTLLVVVRYVHSMFDLCD